VTFAADLQPIQKMAKFKNILVLVLAVLSTQAYAQSLIKGTVIEDATGETLIGVSVIIDGTTTGASTDLDGKFTIKLAPGTYNLTASFISFAKINVSDVVVKEGETVNLGTLRLKSAAEQLQTVVITAKAVKNTEAALMTMKKKSAQMIDGISAASFKKIGDSDAAAAMSRVTGVSVEGGKYIYVRGLGDRYTKTTLNGMDVPGLDPDRNTVQMDIFPTNIIDNIVVSKSFTADLPADFTGGAVDIATKDFPEKKVMTASVGLGYNPNMHFNKNFVTYDGSSTDFLGFDNGKRTIPTDGLDYIPQLTDFNDVNSPQGQLYTQILKDFDPQMGGYRANSFMNTSLGYSFANTKELSDDRSIGYNVAVSYKNDVEFYENAEFNIYGKDNTDNTKTELLPLQIQKGDYGTKNVLIGGMAGVALKNRTSKLRVNLLHLQNGESKAGIFDLEKNDIGTTFRAKQYNLEYTERALTNLLIAGTHNLQDDNWTLDWKISPSRSSMEDPDIRSIRFKLNDDGSINSKIGTEAGLPSRIWRELVEYNIPVKIDGTKKHQLFGRDAKLKTGVSYTYKTRDFSIKSFDIQPGSYVANGDPNDLFKEENLYSDENPGGVYYNATFIGNNPNEYTSSVNHASVYGSEEFNATKDLKAIVGLRIENYTQFYTGTNQGNIAFDKEEVLNDLNFFPTINLIYALNEKQNLRASFSQTIARPSFKELSYAQILDPISGRVFNGGLFPEEDNGIVYWDGNLQSTNINNVDVRWEFYPSVGQSLSATAFYKSFQNPIEIVQFINQPGNFQPRNVGDAQVLGLELELVQSLNILTEKLKNFTFNANFTYAYSEIQMSSSEIRSRQSSARKDETIGTTRKMAGQAPYIINTGLSYNSRENGFTAALSYNVQGETLQYVGFGRSTDVYSVPFHSLNLKLGKTFGVDQRLSASFKVSNILDDNKEQVFRNYMAQDQYLSRLSPGRTFSIGLSYKFY